MRFQTLIFCTILIFSLLLNGCTGEQPKSNTTSNANQTTNGGNPGKTNSELAPIKTPTEAATNNAPTLTPVFKAYCDAMTKKDEAALRKVYSAATLKEFEADMKADNVKTLVEFFESEQVSNDLCEVSNEKIDGDEGTALVKTKGMPTGARLKFVKENGEWKLTNEVPDIKAVENSAKNSNAAR